MVFFFQKANFSFIEFSLLQFFYPLCSLISAISFSLLTLWLAGCFSTTEAYLVLVMVGAFFLEFKTEPLHIAGQAVCYTVQHGQALRYTLALLSSCASIYCCNTHHQDYFWRISHVLVSCLHCHLSWHTHACSGTGLYLVYISMFILGHCLTLSPQLVSSSQWSLSFGLLCYKVFSYFSFDFIVDLLLRNSLKFYFQQVDKIWEGIL